MKGMRTRDLTAQIRRLPLWAVVAASFALTATLSAVDWITGRDVSFLVFYLVPIGFASWFAGSRWGITVALSCGLVWYLEDVMGKESAPSIYLMVWNLATKGIFLIVISRLFSRLKSAMDNEAKMARTDPLTGVANRRVLFDIIEHEIGAMTRNRSPLSLAFIDLDNFKAVNDSIGHDAGDEVLRAVVRGMKSVLRGMDLVARVGGDEFVVLLPDTDSFPAAEVADRLRKAVLNEMEKGMWPCDISIGLVTCQVPPCDPDELLARADKLMYQAKKMGRGRTVHESTAPIAGGEDREKA